MENNKLVDSLYNINMVIVASPRLRDFLKNKSISDVEFHDVNVFNHQGELVEPKYTIIRPIDHIDCLDIGACDVTYSPINKKIINKVKRLEIEEAKIPSNRLLFRPKGYYRVVLVHKSLAKAIDDSGFRWIELENWSGS